MQQNIITIQLRTFPKRMKFPTDYLGPKHEPRRAPKTKTKLPFFFQKTVIQISFLVEITSKKRRIFLKAIIKQFLSTQTSKLNL